MNTRSTQRRLEDDSVADLVVTKPKKDKAAKAADPSVCPSLERTLTPEIVSPLPEDSAEPHD